MNKRIIARTIAIFIVLSAFPTMSFAQFTETPRVGHQTHNAPIIVGVGANRQSTDVIIDFNDYITQHIRQLRGDKIAINENTSLSYTDPLTGTNVQLPLIGLGYFHTLVNDFRSCNIGQKYSLTNDLNGMAVFRLSFAPLPAGVNKITIQCPPMSFTNVAIQTVVGYKYVGSKDEIDAILSKSSSELTGLYYLQYEQDVENVLYSLVSVALIPDFSRKNQFLLVAYDTKSRSIYKTGEVV